MTASDQVWRTPQHASMPPSLPSSPRCEHAFHYAVRSISVPFCTCQDPVLASLLGAMIRPLIRILGPCLRCGNQQVSCLPRANWNLGSAAETSKSRFAFNFHQLKDPNGELLIHLAPSQITSPSCGRLILRWIYGDCEAALQTQGYILGYR
jgi:hypothetical protein